MQLDFALTYVLSLSNVPPRENTRVWAKFFRETSSRVVFHHSIIIQGRQTRSMWRPPRFLNASWSAVSAFRMRVWLRSLPFAYSMYSIRRLGLFRSGRIHDSQAGFYR